MTVRSIDYLWYYLSFLKGNKKIVPRPVQKNRLPIADGFELTIVLFDGFAVRAVACTIAAASATALRGVDLFIQRVVDAACEGEMVFIPQFVCGHLPFCGHVHGFACQGVNILHIQRLGGMRPRFFNDLLERFRIIQQRAGRSRLSEKGWPS